MYILVYIYGEYKLAGQDSVIRVHVIIRIDYCTLALIVFRSYFHAGNKFVFVFDEKTLVNLYTRDHK